MNSLVKSNVRKLLIVDDEKPLRTLFSMALDALDYENVEAESGVSALDELGKDNSFNLVLLDLSMPGLSGLDVLRLMRERGDYTPVVILSAFIPGSAILKAAFHGVSTFVGKPVTLDRLRETVTTGLMQEPRRSFLRRAHKAALRSDFEEAARILGGIEGRSRRESLWLQIYEAFADGKRPSDLRHLEKQTERLVIH